MPPLSAPQARRLAVAQQPADSAFHTSQVSLSFGEVVDPAVLRRAWEACSAALPCLRTVFEGDGVTVKSDLHTGWQDLDWKTNPPADLAAEWQKLTQQDANTPLAVNDQPTCRITLIQLPNGSGHGLWSFHAALLDEAAVSTVLHAWLIAYDAIRTGEDVPDLSQPDLERTIDESWRESFATFRAGPPLIILPLPDSPGRSDRRASLSRTYERADRAEFVTAAEACKADLRSLVGATWAYVVARATLADEIITLEPETFAGPFGRREALVPRLHRTGNAGSVTDLVAEFSKECVAPSAPPEENALTEVLDASALDQATSYVYRDFTINDRLQLAMPRWMAADVRLSDRSPGAITLRFIACDRPELHLDYDPARLSDAAAATLFSIFQKTLHAFVADPTIDLTTFELPAEPAVSIGAEVAPTFGSLVPQRINESFSDLAKENPDAVALECGSETLTAGQLDAAANQFARFLRKRKLEPGNRVAISLAHTARWPIAVLGAWKAGLTIALFETRKSKHDIHAWIVDSVDESTQPAVPVIDLSQEWSAVTSEKSRGVQIEAASSDKAVCLEIGGRLVEFDHEQLNRAFTSATALMELTPADRVLQFFPTHTLQALEGLLSTLLSGATAILREESRWATRTAFQEFITQSAVSVLMLPVPFWSQWMHYLAELSLPLPEKLRLAVVIGDDPPLNSRAAWAAATRSARLLSRLRCESAAGLGIYAELHADTSPATLGTATPATRARVVDARGFAMPAGFFGTIEISADGQTHHSLQHSAFLSADGEFFSRSAIEELAIGRCSLSEAESIRRAAMAHPGIFDCHLERRTIDEKAQWCLWVVPRDSQRGEPHDFRQWLADRLQEPPRRVRGIPRLPLNAAGEVDSDALTDLLPEDAVTAPARRGSPIEEEVRAAVSRALGGRRVELDELITDAKRKPQLAEILAETVRRIEPRVEPSDFAAGFSVRSLVRTARGRAAATPDSKWTPLTPLRASGNLPPIILVHDFDGSAESLRLIAAHLGDDQPCYAISARGLADPGAAHRSIEEMARDYVAALRVFDAEGPYRIVGSGFGGLVAFEMAIQLRSANAEVELVAALGTEPPGGNSALGFLAGGWKRSLRDVFAKKSVERTRPRGAADSLSETHRELSRNYSPGAASVGIHVFVPEEDFPTFREVQKGWLSKCENAHFYQVPCSPREMLEEPAVEAIAGAIASLARSGEVEG